MPDVSLAQHIKRRNPYASRSFYCHDSKKVPIYWWIDRAGQKGFQSSDGAAWVRTHDFPVTLCSITERL